MATLANIRTRLGIRLGEGNVSDTTRLQTFDEIIRSVIEDVRSRKQWEFDQTTLNVSFNSSGVSTITLTNFDFGSFQDLREVNSGENDDYVYTLIDIADKDKYNIDSDYPVWITGNDVDGWKLNILETDSPTLQLTYTYADETALTGSTDETRVPLNVIVAGAYAYIKKVDDDEYNNRDDLAAYENEITKLKIKYDRHPKDIQAPTEKAGYSIGQYVGE